MNWSTNYLNFLLFLVALHGHAYAVSDMRPAIKAEKEPYSSTVSSPVDTVKNAMPPAPAGWVIMSETARPETVSNNMSRLHFHYLIIFKRVAGVDEEKKKLRNAYADSSRKHEEESRTAIEELIDQQSETSRALGKATKRRHQADIQHLNEELEENGRKMMALHKNIDDNIARDVEPYLVKDAEASIRVSVNDSYAELPSATSFMHPQAAFALHKEGEKIGATDWSEGQTMLLYGNWQKAGQNIYRANIDQSQFTSSAKTITIVISGDKKRIDDLLQRLDLKSILSLMK